MASTLASLRHMRRQADLRRRVSERERRTTQWKAQWNGTEQPVPALGCEAAARFDASDPAILAHLEEHGYVVVKGISSAEVEAAKVLLWEFLEVQKVSQATILVFTNSRGPV